MSTMQVQSVVHTDNYIQRYKSTGATTNELVEEGNSEEDSRTMFMHILICWLRPQWYSIHSNSRVRYAVFQPGKSVGYVKAISKPE